MSLKGLMGLNEIDWKDVLMNVKDSLQKYTLVKYAKISKENVNNRKDIVPSNEGRLSTKSHSGKKC